MKYRIHCTRRQNGDDWMLLDDHGWIAAKIQAASLPGRTVTEKQVKDCFSCLGVEIADNISYELERGL